METSPLKNLGFLSRSNIPDIKETVVPIHKHDIYEFSECFAKTNWNISGSLKKSKSPFHDTAEKVHGRKPSFVSHEGDHGVVPHSELAMHTKMAGKKIKQYALFSHPEHGHVNYAHIQTHDGSHTHGLPSEVLPHEIRSKHVIKAETKGDIEKTQKNPLTTVPYEEKPSFREYVKNPDNTSGHMQSLRDKDCSKCPHLPPELHASGAMNKADINKISPTISSPTSNPTPAPAAPTVGGRINYPGANPVAPIGKAELQGPMPKSSEIKPAEKNPSHPKPPISKNWAYNWSR